VVRYADHVFAAADLIPGMAVDVCERALSKDLEFRGCATVEVQVDELVKEGALKRAGGMIART